jgi:hypothetical protein
MVEINQEIFQIKSSKNSPPHNQIKNSILKKEDKKSDKISDKKLRFVNDEYYCPCGSQSKKYENFK